MAFKSKPEKHKFRVNIKTIDEMHKEHVDDFKKKHDTLPIKKKRLEHIEAELQMLEEKKTDMPINLDIDMLKRINGLKSDAKKLKREIENANQYNDEMRYYSRTGDVLHDYYDLTNGILYGVDSTQDTVLPADQDKSDQHVNWSDKQPPYTQKIQISDELMAITNHNKKRKIKKPVKRRNKNNVVSLRTALSYLVGDDEKPDTVEHNTCKATLQNQYLMMMDKEYACTKVKHSFIRKCERCKIDMVIVYNESIISCPKCGESDEIFIEAEIPSNCDTINEKPKYPYKRICHCIEKLNQYLCKGTANIPPEVFDTLKAEIEKHAISKDDVTIKFLEYVLKKHRMSEYYEYIMYIYSRITNTAPQTITRHEYETVLKMFSQADVVYEKKYKPKNRDNFLKYTFTLSKIFMIIGRKEIAGQFKLLKSPIKMKEQERIWQHICKDLGWEYYGS